MSLTPRLWLASLMVCGLFVAEDPAVVAVRTRASDSLAAGVAIDLGLAVLMVAYNFASSRYVVSIASATQILTAMSDVDLQRSQRIGQIRNPLLRRVRQVASHLNPFDLIKVAGERLGGHADRVGLSVRRRRFDRVGSMLEDLGAVNVLGVPGAGLALSTSGHRVSRRQSLRHCILFVLSWFVGARILGIIVGGAHDLPGVGVAFEAFTGALGVTFATLTDVTRPIGLVVVVASTLSIVRYTGQVERTVRRNAHSDATAVAGSIR